jgi:large subunit ribosomal protein L7/L12
MADLQKIADELSKLTVLEAADLSKMLKEKLSSPPSSAVLHCFPDATGWSGGEILAGRHKNVTRPYRQTIRSYGSYPT